MRVALMVIVITIIVVIINVIEVLNNLPMVASKSCVGGGGGGSGAFLVLGGLSLPSAGGSGRGIWGGRDGVLRVTFVGRVRVCPGAPLEVPRIVVMLGLREVGWGRGPRLAAGSSSSVVRSAPGSWRLRTLSNCEGGEESFETSSLKMSL